MIVMSSKDPSQAGTSMLAEMSRLEVAVAKKRTGVDYALRISATAALFSTLAATCGRRARNSLQPRVRGDYRFGASEQTAECFAQLGLVESCGEITMNVSDGALQYVQVISDRRQLFSSHCQDVVADPRSRR